MVKMVEVIEGTRIARGMTRSKMAEEMQEESNETWTKEKLDKVLSGDFCPRTETVFLMLKVLGMACYPWDWCRSKKVGGDEEE